VCGEQKRRKRMWIIAQPSTRGLGEARFADAGLTHSARPSHRRVLSAASGTSAARSPHRGKQWRSGYAQASKRLSTALAPDHSPDARVAEASDGHAPESEILEGPRRGGGCRVDDHRVRLGQA